MRVEIEVEGKGEATGASAEFLVPKWFDKRPHLSPEETVDGVAPLAADRARALSGASGFEPRSACTRRASARRSRPAPSEDIPPLAAAYGPAEIDKAILDALLRCAGVELLRRHGGQYRR